MLRPGAPDGERSSRVKVADRGFASQQSASLVPIKRSKLRRFVLYDGRELCVSLRRLEVNHFFNFIDFERCAPGALNTINRLYQPELLSQNPQRLVFTIGQERFNQAPATAAHAIEIDFELRRSAALAPALRRLGQGPQSGAQLPRPPVRALGPPKWGRSGHGASRSELNEPFLPWSSVLCSPLR
jgi:hypothetical protein